MLNDKEVKINDKFLENNIRIKLSLRQDEVITVSSMKNLKEIMCMAGVGDLSGLEYAVNLKMLYLYCNGNIQNLDKLTKLHKLEYLTLINADIDDTNNLSKLKSLKQLDIIDNKKLIDIEFIKNLIDLEELCFENTDVIDISPIKNLDNLETLHLTYNNIRDYSPIKKLKKLKSLTIDVSKVDNIGFLNKCSQLEELVIADHYHIDDYSVISKMKNLKYLSFVNGSIKNMDFAQEISSLRNLTVLNNGIRDISMFFDFTELEYLNLKSNEITDIKGISKMGNLRYINFEDNNITDFSPLGGLINLEEFEANYSEVENGRPEIIIPTPKENKTKVDYQEWIYLVGDIDLDKEEEKLLSDLIESHLKSKATEILKKSPRMLTFTYRYFSKEELVNLFKEIICDSDIKDEYIEKFLSYKPFLYAGINLDEFEFAVEHANDEVRRRVKKIKLVQTIG